MRRALFAYAAALSAVACAGVLLLWHERATVRRHVGHDRAGARMWSAWTDDAAFKTLSAYPWPSGDGFGVTRSSPVERGPEPILFVDPPVHYKARFTLGFSWGTGYTLVNEDGSVRHVQPGTWPEGGKSPLMNWWCLDVPYPPAVAAMGALPALWLVLTLPRLVVRRRRRTRGLCLRCGYDLRASRGRCPECGAAPASREARPATDAEPAPVNST